MKKTFKLEGDLCANCAAKIEGKIARLDGVESASINFMTMKLKVDYDADRQNNLIDQAQQIIDRIEPGCTIVR